MQVLAVLDWELATLGNAWADVAYMCLAYHLPPVLATMSLKHPLASGAQLSLNLLMLLRLVSACMHAYICCCGSVSHV
jgi:aminoglycoside phosphotransferase (APT) family kinase protein